MRGCLVLISPLDPATGNRVTVRVGTSRNSKTLQADGQQWFSAVSHMPRISLDFFDVDYKGTVQTGKAALTLNTKRIAGLSRDYLTTLIWAGAPITIWSGDAGTTAEMFMEFNGLVTQGVIDRSSGLLPLQCEVNKKLMDVPLLNVEYGGGGGSDGDAEVRGTLKPAAFGNPFNVPVFFFDQTNWVGQVDGYGNCTAINEIYEDAAAFGAGNKVGNYATYAALVAAVIPEGKWASCVAEGMIRVGANPQGVITCDPVCGYGTPGTMMSRWLTAHAGITVGNINAQSFTDLDTTLTALLGHAPAVSFWTQTQTTVLERIQAMCASVNATPLQGPDGKITVSRAISAAAPVITLNRLGGDPLVTDWRSLDTPEPWWRLKASAARTWRVHDLGEIDYEDELRDMGDYDGAEEYREGMVVRSPTDGIRYLYINANPSTGHAPPNAVYWAAYEDAPDASVVRYLDGVPVQSLQPAQVGSDVTATHTAAGILGQGPWATLQTDVAATFATITAASDDNILNQSEKMHLVSQLGRIDAEYADLVTRATALAISTAGITAKRNSLYTTLNSYNPAWNDRSASTTLSVSLFPDGTVFPGSWTLSNGLSTASNTPYTTLTDANNAAQGSIFFNVAQAGVNQYSAGVYVKKDAVAAATRFVALGLGTVGGTLKTAFATLDTSTGQGSSTGAPDDFGVFDLGAEWYLWITFTTNADNTFVRPLIYAAYGANANITTGLGSAVGSVDVRDPAFALGTVNKLGGPTLAGRMSDYSKSIASLLRAITEQGADISNLTDSGSGDPVTHIPRGEVRTPLGTAAGIIGQGVLATLNSVDWSTYVTGLNRPSDNAAALATPIGVSGTWTIVGNSATKTSAAAWTAFYLSEPLLGSGIVRWKVNNAATGNLWMGGLSDTPTTPIILSADVEADMDYGIYKYGAGDLRPRASVEGYGTQVPDVVDDDTIYTIIYDGVFVRAFYNSTQLTVWNVGPGRTFYPKFYVFNSGQTFSAMRVTGFGLLPDMSSNIYDLSGGTPYSPVARGEIRTPLGTAAGIAGQGTLATRGWARFGLHVRRSDDVTVVGDADAITSIGTAAGIFGQGALATRGRITASLLPPIEGANLVLDPLFDDFSDATAPSWGGTNGPTLPVPISAPHAACTAMAASKVLQFPSAGAAANAAPRANNATGNRLQVQVGDTYRLRLSTYVEAGFNGQLSVGFFCYGPTSAFVSSRSVVGVDYRTVAAAANTAAIISGVPAAVPAGTAFIQPFVTCTWGANPPAANGYVALPEVRRVSRLNDVVTREDGTTLLTDALAVTSIGTAAGIVGQGAFATRSSIGYGDAALTGFGTLAPRNNVRFGNEVFRANGSTLVGDADAVTSLGTAAGIAGQGALATRNSALPSQLPMFEGQNIFADADLNDPAYWMLVGGNINILPSTDAQSIALGVNGTFQFVAASTTAGSTNEVRTTNKFPSQPGLSYRISGKMRLAGGFNGMPRLGFRCYDLTGTGFLGSVLTNVADYRTVPLGGTTNFDISSGPLLTLANTAYIWPFLWITWGASAPAGNAYYGGMAFRQVSTLGGLIAREDGVTTLTDLLAVTALGTAAAITGQGNLATRNNARLGNEVYRANGTTQVQDADAITSLGTAAGITGQGALATLNSVAYGSGQVTGFGTLAARSNVRLANEVYRANGSTIIADADAITSLGTAAGITGQGTLATRNNARLGTEVYRADGTTILTDALAVTSLGTAASITGQADWATYTGVNTTTMANRTQWHDNTTGRIVNAGGYKSNRSYGLRSVWTGVTFTDTWVGTNNVTINIPASTLTADDGTSLSLPSGSLTGCASGTKFYIYRTLADPKSATGTYGKSTTLAGAMAGDNTYMGYWTTRATSGSGGGGGGGGGLDCVAAEAWVPLLSGRAFVRAHEVRAGDVVYTLNEKTMGGFEPAAVTRNHVAIVECVKLTAESGITLTLSIDTPLTLRSGLCELAPNALGRELPVQDGRGFRWEKIVKVEAVGKRRVAHISCGGRTFAAGDDEGRFIYTHNQVKP